MWKKIVAPILLFYFFALLQTSFFVHFSLFGVVPDLVFILYFGFTFYSIKKNQLLGNARVYEMVFLAITAGFFLDIFQQLIRLNKSSQSLLTRDTKSYRKVPRGINQMW